MEIVKVNKNDSYIFADESGTFKINGKIIDVLSLYCTIGVTLKDNLKDDKDIIESFNSGLRILLTDDPKQAVKQEAKQKIKEALEILDKED